MTTTAAPETPVAMPRRATVIAIGNEIDKGLRFGWDERRQILLELTMFVPMFYLSPLPSWVVAAAGRLLASLLETLAVVGSLYAVVALSVGVDLDWDPAVLAPVGFLIVGSVGLSLVIGALTLIWKRVERCSTTRC
jgi:hypothetical protein